MFFIRPTDREQCLNSVFSDSGNRNCHPNFFRNSGMLNYNFSGLLVRVGVHRFPFTTATILIPGHLDSYTQLFFSSYFVLFSSVPSKISESPEVFQGCYRYLEVPLFQTGFEFVSRDYCQSLSIGSP